MYDQISETLQLIKQQKPLILNITNYVTMDFVANGLLSLGASPVMSFAEQEVEDLLLIAKVVVINLGTLDEKFIKLCDTVCRSANHLNRPIILDPVGVGASRYRTEIATQLINDHRIAIVRGNASEIAALAGSSVHTKGVDSTLESEQAITNAKKLSNQFNFAVVISGKTDVVIDGAAIQQFSRGSHLMPTITGTGCLMSSIVGAFHAIEENRFLAASFATVFYGLCGEVAAKNAMRPASFKMQFIDTLYSIPTREQYEIT